MKTLRSTALHCFFYATCCALPAGPALAATQTTIIQPTDSTPARIIKGYFAGWERKDWDAVARLLAPEFTFSSPAPDDHLPIDKFKAKCWNQAAHIDRFEFPKIIGDDQEALAIVHVVTKEGKIVRNIEFFTFRDGKVKSIEVFFGGTGGGFPTNAR
jgi:ketosteroid isomerase-like protein